MTKTKLIAISILGLALCVSSAFGQATLGSTSLTGAITSASATTIQVASTAGITAQSPFQNNVANFVNAGSMLFIEDGTSANAEAMLVTAVLSTTQLQVVRGYASTVANPHITGLPVLFGRPDQFYTVEPSGACTSTAIAVTPYVNVRTGNQWLCSSVTGAWIPGFFNVAVPAGVSTAVASAATATPSGPLFHVTGAVAITTIGSGVGMGGSTTSAIGAPFCIIPDNATVAGLTAGNNIAKSTTFVVNQPVCLVFDQTNKKYVASY